MKILLFHLSGTPLYAAEIAHSLADKGHNVHAIVAQRNLNEDFFDENIYINPIGISTNLKTLLRCLNPLTYVRIIKQIKTIDPDVIHITQGFLWLNPVLPFISEYPILYTDHEPEEVNDVTLYDRTNIYSFSKSHMRRYADKIIVHGDYLKEILLSRGIPEDKVVVISHGTYRYYEEVDNGEDTDSMPNNNVLFFGLLADYKGISVLAKAIPQIRNRCPEATFTIAGKGDIDSYMPDNLLKEDYITIYNEFIPDERVGPLFRNAEIVVLPYTSGSQSGVLTISYQFKTPVVVTNVGSLPEAVDNHETGIIVPPNEPDLLSEGICRILSSSRTQKNMEQAITEKVESELSWDIICNNLIELYSDLSDDH
ncbi:Glycosyltransferase involved in cell wall bisynthesis [Halopenitus malekzadehii]|uniref:Glycosyltransferase involved in cell wall bisynthesis n=1 Tax=Halopenitus malekzadehii TaxID=1267564 RepID=A0A1H6IGR4_9EURY|nr:glycosyltransferase family 4 protein [Halopenitus malekzadehii]SEH45456.1 Glycosyltransferase involved in cell wall bisynthesis [Halopenitus malekzadehii]